ncbi:PDR/VanB family oxidoreductase [Bradyrhizobium sp. CCGB12]|uniref:PDR/VanB family oxidoreductase n=1 Tax=Bradyrhizobium sp. CCGB12 TaxID=2949632 RepID=UPI0020B229A8|nr:PDR/VanB family oxidoreductase [Bradyrhizobium sp. CCGB12]MCP3394014.1 PDR/VanB family oxidoreductase [Bradyrhizobium sp. CCGB12]
MSGKCLDAVVLARRALTGRIAEFCIGRADGRPLPMAESGSHIELHFGGGEYRFVRHYSIVGPLTLRDDPEPFWRIAVQREDRARGSAFIHDTFRTGTALTVSRPVNAFRLARHQANTLLVAGGIGVTPMLAMARSLRMRNLEFSMLYAGQDRPAMAYVDELESLCGDRLTVHQSKRDGIPDLVDLLSGQPAETIAYVCGPAVMIEAVRDAAAALGWRNERIRFEVFNAAHRPDDRDFEVRLSTGRRVKVGAGTTILEALELAGVDTLSSCRRGECGLCIADVAGCDGQLDHRDRYFSNAEHRAGGQIAICCSRITGRALALNV